MLNATLRCSLSLLVLGLALVGCAEERRQLGEAGAASVRDGGTVDGGSHSKIDAGSTGCEERLECIGAPLGCRYVGGDGCRACGTLVCTDAGAVGARDAGQADGGAADAGRAADAGIPCRASVPSAFRTCSATSDCAVLVHEISCCGTLHASGIRADEQTRFATAAAACGDSPAVCDCIAAPTVADDNSRADAGPARAVCIDGLCTSTFTTPSAGACTPRGNSCGLGMSCCYPCGIPDCMHICEPSCAAGSPACYDGCRARP
jgi:hypothetical protein